MARIFTRIAFAFAAVLIASVAFVGAVAFLFYALYLFFTGLIAPPLAALATAGFLIVFALLVLLVGRGFASVIIPSRKPADEQAEHPLTHILGREIGGLASKNPFLAVGAALLAGLVVGVSPGLRKVILDFFKR